MPKLPQFSTNGATAKPDHEQDERGGENDGHVDRFFTLPEAEQDAVLGGVVAKTLAEALTPWHKERCKRDQRDQRLSRLLLDAWEHSAKNPFPLHVYPKSVIDYIRAWSVSINCSHDLLAVPLLAVAGAAIGRTGRRLRVQDGWTVSSCLWAVCLAGSSEGKSPAFGAVQNFYLDKQRELIREWLQAMAEAAESEGDEGKKKPKPEPQPTLYLTDTTIESLRHDLASGPVLYGNDELGAWCQQMGQYKAGKAGNADKAAWCSFWSHAPVSIGRKTERLFIDEPFVAVAGMLVPASAHQLNYRGHEDDGFVHRMLIACPPPSTLLHTGVGVPAELIAVYKEQMGRLFDPSPEGKYLRVDPKAKDQADKWVNKVHYAELDTKDAPDWLKAKYKKLWDNLWRIALVLHELRRVAETPEERAATYRNHATTYGTELPPYDPMVVDAITIERAITVVEYFKDHIHLVQNHLGDAPMDDTDGLYRRFRFLGEITMRDFMLRTSYKSQGKPAAMGVFAEWRRRGYGTVETGKRKDQCVFKFTKESDGETG